MVQALSKLALVEPPKGGARMTVDWAVLARQTQMLTRCGERTAVFEQLLEAASELGAEAAAVWLFDKSTYRLQVAVERGLESDERTGEGRPDWPDLFKIPLSSGGGLTGVVEFYTCDPDGFTDDQRSAFTILAAAGASALQHTQVAEELRSAEERAAARGAVDALETIVHSLPQGVVLLDASAGVLLANRNGRDYLAQLNDAGEPVRALGGVPLRELLEEAVDSGIDLCRREIELRATDRTWHFAVTVVPVGENGQHVGTVLSVEDISLQRQSEQRMFHDARLASIGEFASGLAHELNNPMMILLGLAEMLHDDPALPEDRRGLLEDMQQAAVRAAQIVQQMTVFSDTQSEAGWAVLQLRDVLDQAAALVVNQCEADGIEVRQDWADDLPAVFGDAGKLQQLVLDLLHNAHEAIVQSGLGSRIELRGRAVGSEVWIEVSDDGPGVPPDLRAKIFDLFFTTKRDHQGKGLGLSVAHRAAQEHGGSLTVEEAPSGGALLRVRLPQHRWTSQALDGYPV